MPCKVIITRDFDHVSEVAARYVATDIRNVLEKRPEYNIGLATGMSPSGLYKDLAKTANNGGCDSSRIRSFNLDEYIGLPGENPQQRALHPESYSFFMIQELFGLLQKKFRETNVPWGCLIDQEKFIAELKANPGDWEEHGKDKGRSIVIKAAAKSEYLRWVRRGIQEAYEAKIKRMGGIDLHIVGVGGRGHVGFHEAGIPFAGSRVLIVKLDDNTIQNAVTDGHFRSIEESPRYAVSMGAELIYEARKVLLVAMGKRKAEPIVASLAEDPTDAVPISYGQIFSQRGGEMIYVIDREAAAGVYERMDAIKARGVQIEDVSSGSASRRVQDLIFFRNPETGLMG
ncbi:MAG TPA: 6-phosphogluconolactonase [Kiritimatiellia bacterium]|nr:6-phosphogluconolactonase [Kiritimatiellia bacterium]HRZ13285.1 6-phosphogluconolactonase [Kiritimatiellia bacterium]HSA18734.1 6-phosphogluconolactonase [Kiritimatiellia bacterium]